MKKMSKTIVFFGSGPVAAAALKLLVEDFNIEAVVTKPRAAHHKGSVPVLELCEELSLPVHTPSNKSELSLLFTSKPFSSEVGLVIDYGIIINKDVIDYFPYGIINSHFSLLPEWRGADPISFAILSGQNQTGVSVMLINEKMDEGLLLGVGVHDLTGHETTPTLTEELIQLSHGLLVSLMPLYLEGETLPMPQELIAEKMNRSSTPSYSRKLTKSDSIIDWNKPAAQIEREVRAFTGWPGSRTSLFNKDLLITDASVVGGNGKPGEILRNKKSLSVYCGKDALRILNLKPAGKKEMPIEAFLAGLQSNSDK